MLRDYDNIRFSIAGDRPERLRSCVDALWDSLSPTGVSWVGFYLPDGADALVLGPCRDKPACSPIGMHGACGQAFTEKKPLVVRDVADLGPNYIACDPRDLSEVVIPLLNEDGSCWAVLDLDSHDRGAFDRHDVAGLTTVLKAAKLSC